MGIKQYPHARIVTMHANTVSIRQATQSGPEGEERREITLPCDMLVVAVGSEPERGLYEALAGQGRPVHLVGDAGGVGKISDAVRQACALADETGPCTT